MRILFSYLFSYLAGTNNQDMKKIKLYLAHSQEVFLFGLHQGLANLNCQIVASHKTGIDALNYILEERPSIAIIEANMPVLSAFDIMKTASDKGVTTKFIIVFSNLQEEHLVLSRIWQLSGTIYTGDSFESIVGCIQKVVEGKKCVSDSFLTKQEIFDDVPLKNVHLLSETQINILSLIAPYKTSAAIAKVLNLSERTIEKHRSNIINKLKLPKKTNSLTKWAMKNHVLIRNIALRTNT